MKKTYISTTGTQYTFPVNIAGKVKFISLNSAKNDITTESVLLQNAIEESNRFLKGEIELLSGEPNKKPVEKEETPKADVLPASKERTKPAEQVPVVEVPPIPKPPIEDVDPQTDEEPDSKIYPQVTTLQEAAEILRKKYGVMHQSVRTPEGIAKKAKELGVEFPNLK